MKTASSTKDLSWALRCLVMLPFGSCSHNDTKVLHSDGHEASSVSCLLCCPRQEFRTHRELPAHPAGQAGPSWSLPTATPTLSHQVPAIPIVRPHNALASWPPGLSPHDGWPFCLCRVFSVALTAKPWQCLVEIYVHLPQILCSASLFPQRAYFYLFIPQTSSLVPPVGFLVGTEN